jgi:hypothetical protein
MEENSEEYIIDKDSEDGQKVIQLTSGRIDLKLPPEMTYVGGNYLRSKFYHIAPGATASINTPFTCPASGVHEVTVKIFAEKPEVRTAAKFTLESFLGFKL